MLRGIDHLVLAVDDPDSAAATLEAELGLRAEGGGRHDALGTFNRLVWLGDTYLELIGAFDRSLAATSWLGRPVLAALELGGGLATWAVAVDDLEAQLRWSSDRSGLIGPVAGERRRPDGAIVRWRLAHTPTPSPLSPFLIEHDATAAEWTPAEREARAAESQPVGGRVRLGGLEVLAAVPPAAAGRLRSLLATSAEADGRQAVRVRIGSDVVRFVASRPRGAAAIELVVDAPLRRRVAWLGECEVRLRGTSVDRPGGVGARPDGRVPGSVPGG